MGVEDTDSLDSLWQSRGDGRDLRNCDLPLAAGEDKADCVGSEPRGADGILKRGAIRYQLLVPSYIVMFAFFLVLTVGWLFVAERRQGTLKRLRAHILARVSERCKRRAQLLTIPRRRILTFSG